MKQVNELLSWIDTATDPDNKEGTRSEYGCIISLPGETPLALHVVEFRDGRVRTFTTRKDNEISEDIMMGHSFNGDELYRLIEADRMTMINMNVGDYNNKPKGERIIYSHIGSVISALEAELGYLLIKSHEELGIVKNKHVALIGTGVCWVNHAKAVGEMVQQCITVTNILHRLWKLTQEKGKEINDQQKH